MTTDRHILFVDDDEEDHLIISQYFKDLGKEKRIRFIKNGLEAIRFLEHIPDEASLPCLIVLDLNMPILNGTQTLLQIKRNRRLDDIPVIILSTSENESEKRKCLSLGATEYLVKPSTYLDGVKLTRKFTAYFDAPAG